MKKIIFLSALALIFITANWAWGGRVVNRAVNIDHAVDSTLDTAHVVKVTTFTARDSFAYIDSIYNAARSGTWTTGDSVVSWTTPPQIMILTPTVDVATTYSCSVDLGTNISGYEKDYSGGVATLAALIDTLVAGINGVATLSDTIVAEDSATYILLRSKIAMDDLEGDARWTCKMVTAGGTGTLDTASHGSLVTIKMICDTMAAKINAADSISVIAEAANSGDTVYTITARDPGVALVVGIADTAQDTIQITANAANNSTTTDTTYLVDGMHELDGTVWGFIYLDASGYAGQGYGLSDSAWMQLYTIAGDQWQVITADTFGALPCSIRVAHASSTAGADTLFKEHLALISYIQDTATDTTVTATHSLRFYFIVK